MEALFCVEFLSFDRIQQVTVVENQAKDLVQGDRPTFLKDTARPASSNIRHLQFDLIRRHAYAHSAFRGLVV